jgi:hypothetical protein
MHSATTVRRVTYCFRVPTIQFVYQLAPKTRSQLFFVFFTSNIIAKPGCVTKEEWTSAKRSTKVKYETPRMTQHTSVRVGIHGQELRNASSTLPDAAHAALWVLVFNSICRAVLDSLKVIFYSEALTTQHTYPLTHSP